MPTNVRPGRRGTRRSCGESRWLPPAIGTRRRLATFLPMALVCMTWRAMSGSGARTGSITIRGRFSIHAGSKKDGASSGLSGVEHGTARSGTCVSPTIACARGGRWQRDRLSVRARSSPEASHPSSAILPAQAPHVAGEWAALDNHKPIRNEWSKASNCASDVDQC